MIGQRLIKALLESDCSVDAVISESGVLVFKEELGIDLGRGFEDVRRNFLKAFGSPATLSLSNAADFAACVSSGSNEVEGMIIAPCSMSTAASIAHGVTINLIHRAAGVSLKERRTLVLVPRESPMSTIHLENLHKLSQVGAFIVPATTAFYHRPKNVEEMVDFTVGRVLDIFKIKHKLFTRWRENSSAE